MDLKQQLRNLIVTFFDEFDRKNGNSFFNICAPNLEIIHHNGVTTNLNEMVEIIKLTKNWYPRTRKLSNFTYMPGTPYTIVGFKNIVTFELPDSRKVKEQYRETWVFKEISSNNWKPVRIHYSSITQAKHSEEVK